MLIDFYLILFVIAIISLIFAVKKNHLLPAMFSTVIFLMLALQGFAIEYITAAGTTIVFDEIVLVLINWFLGFVSFVVCLIAAVNMLRGGKDVEKGIGVN